MERFEFEDLDEFGSFCEELATGFAEEFGGAKSDYLAVFMGNEPEMWELAANGSVEALMILAEEAFTRVKEPKASWRDYTITNDQERDEIRAWGFRRSRGR